MANNTYLLQSDNTIIQSEKNPIIEKSNNVDSVFFVVERYYGPNDIDMTEFDLVMEYRLPISKTVHIVKLDLVEEDYKEHYLKYAIPLKAKNICSETGAVEMNLQFLKISYNPETGEPTEYARNFTPAILNVLPLSTFFNPTDSGLSDLAEIYLKNQAQIEALQAIISAIGDSYVADLTVNQEGRLRLKSAAGNPVGEGVDVVIPNVNEQELDRNVDGIVNLDDVNRLLP